MAALLATMLVLLLLPAINTPRHPHGVLSQVKSELFVLEAALANFRAEFGFNPPSGIVLHSNRPEWDSDPQSKAKLLRVWPQFDFDNCEGLEQVPNGGVSLNGSEALVLFLGGPNSPVDGYPNGFSMSDENPFDVRDAKRRLAFFNFMNERLVDVDGDGYWEYCDPYGPCSSPIVYACQWEGRYHAEDYRGFIHDVYRMSRDEAGETWSSKKGFQLISPGLDRKYGIGGYYSPTDKSWSSKPIDRSVELDNITSFVTGTLGGH